METLLWRRFDVILVKPGVCFHGEVYALPYSDFGGKGLLGVYWKAFVRSGIRTHAHRSGLRPERSALDRSAILTSSQTPS